MIVAGRERRYRLSSPTLCNHTCDPISMLKEVPYIPAESPAAFACSDASLAAL